MRARGAHAAKFSFLKNHRGLKNYFFFQKICKYLPISSKKSRQKENSKFKNVDKIWDPHKWANCFLTWSKEN